MLAFKRFYCDCLLETSFFPFVGRGPSNQNPRGLPFSNWIQYTCRVFYRAFFSLVLTSWALGLAFWCCSCIRCHRILTKLLVSCLGVPHIIFHQFSHTFPSSKFTGSFWWRTRGRPWFSFCTCSLHSTSSLVQEFLFSLRPIKCPLLGPVAQFCVRCTWFCR